MSTLWKQIIERKNEMLTILRYERQVKSESAATLTVALMPAILAYMEGKKCLPPRFAIKIFLPSP